MTAATSSGRSSRARTRFRSTAPPERLTAAAGWSPWRPSHIHLIVSAEGYEPLVTQLFIDTSDYLDDDVASAVKDELIVHPEPTGEGDELGFSYDFALAPVHAPVPVGERFRRRHRPTARRRRGPGQ